jgi:hypothetical protein
MRSLGKDVTARSSAKPTSGTTTEEDVAQPILWAGVDAGKAAHHCVAINADGQRDYVESPATGSSHPLPDR